VAARYSARLSGITQIAVMHLDTLTGLDPIGICTGYRTSAGALPGLVSDSTLMEQAEPVIEYMPGWKQELREARSIQQLPAETREYISRLETLIGVPISIASVGPERTQTLMRS